MLTGEYKASLSQLHKYGKELLPIYRDGYRPLLLSGNDKTGEYGKFGIMKVTRGLPLWDCPSATAVCKDACYAIKYTLWNAMKKRDMGETYSYLSHHDPETLYYILRRDIRAALIYSRNLVTRLHDSGDIVSADHADVYYKLAKEFDEAVFFGFSRSFDDPSIKPILMKLNELPNVSLRYSLDKSSGPPGKHNAPESFFDLSATLTRERLKTMFPSGYAHCPEQRGGPKCINCGLCFKYELPIILTQHR